MNLSRRGGWCVGRRRDGAVLQANFEQCSRAGGLSVMPAIRSL